MAKQKDENQEEATFSSKKMLAKHAKAKTKIRYADRKKVEIVQNTKHYNIGDVINPHKIVAEELIGSGIAKAYKEKEKVEETDNTEGGED
jgi:hypothetical protein